MNSTYTCRCLNFTNSNRSRVIAAGTLDVPDIQPGDRGTVPLPPIPSSKVEDSELWLTVTFTTKHASAWSDANYEVAWFQHRLDSSSLTRISRTANFPLTLTSTKAQHTITGAHFTISFSRTTGSLTNWRIHKQDILSPAHPALTPSFWRPPTDNDIPHDLGEWRRYGLDTLISTLRSLSVKEINHSTIEITTDTFISPPILAWGFQTTTTYRVTGDGALTVHSHIKPTGSKPKDLPRIGYELYLADRLDKTAWFGLGPGEAYPDKKNSQKIGIYSATTSELHTPYEVPQEGGNRMETRWLRLGDGRGWGVRITRDTADSSSGSGPDEHFQWLATRYSPEAIEKAAHANELVAESQVRVRLDVATCGVGTGACGPTTLEKYRIRCEERRFGFRIEPFIGDWA